MKGTKFRGKREDDKTYVTGYLVKNYKDACYIGYLNNSRFPDVDKVIEESVGVVFTKIVDIQHKQIWEKSILQSKQGEKFVIVLDDTETGFVLENIDTGKIYYFNEFMDENEYFKAKKRIDLEVIGNTYDNPELLEEK